MCPNINNKEVVQQFNEIVESLGGSPLTAEEFKSKELRALRSGNNYAAMEAAYRIWDANNGFEIDKAPNGLPSKLFSDLLRHYNGNRVLAIASKSKIYSKLFKNGNRLAYYDNNGEPVIESIINDTTKNKLKTSDPTLSQRIFNGGNEATIELALNTLSSSNPIQKYLIDFILKNITKEYKDKKIVLIEFDKGVVPDKIYYGNNPAFYDPGDGIIYINKNGVFREKRGIGKANTTILHEILHSLLYDNIHSNPDVSNLLLDMLINSIKQLTEKYNKSTEELLKDNTFYGLTNIDEFVSELYTNGAFVKELSNISSIKNSKLSMFDRFINAILSLLGITNKNNQFVEAHNFVKSMFDNFNYTDEVKYNVDTLSGIDTTLLMQLPTTLSNNDKDFVNVYNKMSDLIEFHEDTHSYINKVTGNVYKPVSDVKTDCGYGEQSDKLPEEAQALGNFTAKIGTEIHAAFSAMLLDKYDSKDYPNLSKSTLNSISSIVKNIRKNYSIISSEQILFNDELNVAGTADLIVKDKKTGKIILLDFKTKVRNIGDTKKSGFSYYHSSKYGRPDFDKHNFLLTMYELLHNMAGLRIDERGIIPIEYDATEDGKVEKLYYTGQSKGTTLEEKGYYTIPHRTYIDNDIDKLVIKDGNAEDLTDTNLNDLIQLISKILDSTKNKVVSLYTKGKVVQALGLENLVSSFNSMSEKEIMISYIKSALESLLNIMSGKNGYNAHIDLEDAGKAAWNLKQLNNWKEVAESYQQLDELQNYILDNPKLFDKDQYDDILLCLSQAIQYRTRLEGAYKSKGKALWLKWLQPFVKNIEVAYKIKAEREFKKNNPNGSKKEMEEYIRNYIRDNRQKINKETQDFINTQSIMADKDVNGFYRYVDTVFLSKDPIVSGMAMAYDLMTSQTREQYTVYYRLLVDLTKEFEKQYGGGDFSNSRELYSFMLDFSENGTHLISEMPQSFTVEYKKAMQAILADTLYKDSTEKFKAKMKWLKENAPIKDINKYKEAKLKAIEDYLTDLNASDEEISKILANEKKYRNKKSYAELVKDGVITYSRAEQLRSIIENVTWKFRLIDEVKFPNPKWKAMQDAKENHPDDIKYRLFKTIQYMSEFGDSRISKNYKLNGRIPGVYKSFGERKASGQNVKDLIKDLISRDFNFRADDTMYGQYEFTDENNNPVNFVPVFYTNLLPDADQSYDIPDIYLKWYKSALNYGNTMQIIDYLEYTKYIVNTRLTKSGSSNYGAMMWKKMHPDSPITDDNTNKSTSNLANLLNDWFDMVIYGKKQDRLGTVGNVDIGKVVNVFLKYASLRVMGLNYISMVNNAAMAEVAQATEVMAKKYIDPASYTRATKEYGEDLPNIMGDVGARKVTSKTNLLNELFGTIETQDESIRSKTKLNKLFSTSTLYFTTSIGEHEAQSRFMLGSLIKERAYDIDGNDIGSIYDYYTVENGELIFDKEGKVNNWKPEQRRAFSARLRSNLMSMHGNYSEKDVVALLRNGYLKLALMFRKWIVPTFRKRFDEMYVDNITESETEGYYRTAGRIASYKVRLFFYKFADENKALAMASEADKNILTETEKQNLRRFGTEMSIYGTLLVLYSVIKAAIDDDDDENYWLNNVSYLLFRLRTDIGFYFNPGDFIKIVQSPFPSTSVFKNTSSLIDNIMSPTARYERGPWKDHLKIEKTLYNMLPVVRLTYRYRDIENEFNMLQLQ